MDVKEKFLRMYNAIIERPGADRLLEWMEGNGFFTAPASTKYHGAYEGGLAEHSVNVCTRLDSLWFDLVRCGRKEKYSLETIAVCGLLHDLCKIDAYKTEMKNVKGEDGKWQQVSAYTYTNNFPMGHGEKSVYLIQRFIKLTEEEALAIRWHMGGFDHAVRGGSYDINNAYNQSELAAMLHIADMMATYIDERQENGQDKDLH